MQIAKYLCPVEIKYRLEEIKSAAIKFADQMRGRTVFAFHGNMGAGKTSFIKAVCEIKGVSEVVGSPTFSIINEYSYPGGKIFHIDLYRLKDEDEAIRAGVEDCLYGDHICFIEWPEKASGILPADTLHAFIEVVNSDTRHLTIRDK